MWITKTDNVEVNEEMESDFSKIEKTDAYEVEITGARLAKSKTERSKSVSLVVEAKTDDGDNISTYFTIMGKDGKTYYKYNNNLKQHFGLSTVNTLFGIVLDKEIFDVEPSDIKYSGWDADAKARVEMDGEGFPDLIGKRVGITVQMTREIAGADTKEFGTIEHFFNLETGLFHTEVEPEAGKKTKLDKWIGRAKEYKIVEAKPAAKSSFAKPKAETGAEAPKRRWGK